MEHLYYPEHSAWASKEPTDLSKYSKECSKIVATIYEEEENLKKTNSNLKSVKEEMTTLDDKFLSLREDNAESLYKTFPNVEFPNHELALAQKTLVMERKHRFESECVKKAQSLMDPSKQRLRALRFRSKLVNYVHFNTLLTAVPSPNTKDIPTLSQLFIEVQIYNTCSRQELFYHSPKPKQAIEVLGSQRLTELKDSIFCLNNFIDGTGDISDNIRQAPKNMLKDLLPSSMFFFGDTFYVDGDVDYSESVREWAARKKVQVGVTKQMSETCFQELSIRLHYPYLFQHLGNCEHTVVFSEVRILSQEDPLNEAVYPVIHSFNDSMLQNCRTCEQFIGRYVVRKSDRIIFNDNIMCEACLLKYFYVNGKKVGTFEVLRYFLEENQKGNNVAKQTKRIRTS